MVIHMKIKMMVKFLYKTMQSAMNSMDIKITDVKIMKIAMMWMVTGGDKKQLM